jgi:hypothetical protein
MLDSNSLFVGWMGQNHVIKINDTFDRYTGFKLNDGTICHGSLHPQSLHTYEDSCIAPVANDFVVNRAAERNLVYLCVFNIKSYIDLLKLFLVSYSLFTDCSKIDIVVFTSKEFEADIYSYAKTIGLDVKCRIFDFNGMDESICSRLYLFDYESIGLYKKALYLDTDIIIQGDLQKLFDVDIEDKIYAVKEGTIEHEIHGGWFFDFTKIDKNLPGLNSGVLLFPVTNNIRVRFEAVISHLRKMKERGGTLPRCLDQCTINYHFIKDKCYDVDLMKDYALIYCVDPPPPPSSPTSILISHFVWPLGNTGSKLERMKTHLLHILNNYSKIYPVNELANPTALIGKRYSWGNGYIQFGSNGVLHTQWNSSSISYRMLGPRTVYAEWNNYKHILKFNEAYDKYVQIRIGDLSVGYGSIEIANNCVFDKNKENNADFQITATSEKYLIYACVFINRQYIELLKLLLLSYKLFSYTDQVDILIFTSKEFEDEIQSFAKSISISITCKIFEVTSVHESSCARLYLFEYEHINKYTKAMYIDTDIIIQGDLKKMFDSDTKDKIHAVNEETIDKESHGGWFFDYTVIDKNTPAINAGILLFKISATIKNKFQDCILHIQQIKKANERLPKCFDQPFVNYHFIKDGLHDTQLLNKYALLYNLSPPPPPTGPTEVSLCHFVAPLGAPLHKMPRMIEHLSHLLKNYTSIYNTDVKMDKKLIVGKRYSWGNRYIEFDTNENLKTGWIPGTYAILDRNKVRATWGVHSHILHFDEEATEYISVREGDCIFSPGKLLF